MFYLYGFLGLVTSIPEEYFSDGWSFINREKDDLDVEWNQWMTLIQYKLPLWIILHYVISQIIRKFLLKFCVSKRIYKLTCHQLYNLKQNTIL